MGFLIRHLSFLQTGHGVDGIINFLRKILYILGIPGNSARPAESARLQVEIQTEPKRGIIVREPLLAIKDGFLVVVVDHRFANVPSWVEWDAERGVLSIAQMNGDLDEARLRLKDEHKKTLAKEHKLLLVSNKDGESIVHFVPFLARA